MPWVPTGLADLMRAQSDPSWYRQDGTQKGMGYFGALPYHTGQTSTELSIGVPMNGQPSVDIPSLVPTLTPAEVNHMLLGNPPTPEIIQKATDYARMRQFTGQSPFAGPHDQPVQWGVPWRKP